MRDDSRREWASTNSVEHINTGSLQRIADALEKVAQNYDALLRAKKDAVASADFWRDRSSGLERRINALKGAITKAKRKTERVAP